MGGVVSHVLGRKGHERSATGRDEGWVRTRSGISLGLGGGRFGVCYNSLSALARMKTHLFIRT